MGQKVNPHGMRVGVIKDWDSRWYARADKVGDLIVEDYNIRNYLKKTLYCRCSYHRDRARFQQGTYLYPLLQTRRRYRQGRRRDRAHPPVRRKDDRQARSDLHR